MIREEVIKELFINQDLKYKEFSKRITPTKKEIIGVRMPIIKKIAKSYFKKYGEKLFDELKNEYHEEIMIKGIMIGLLKENQEKYIEKFVPLIDNWATCDTTICCLKFIKTNLEKYYLFLNNKYKNSSKEYEQRFLLVTYLSYYLKDEYIDEILKHIDLLNRDHYYVNMAAAWLLSVAYIKQKDKTIKYLKNNNLDKETYNMTISKICDSYRVTKEEKDYLRKTRK